MWKFLVKQQKIEVLEREVIADHQIAFVNLKFTFDGDWKKFHKVVQFSQCDEVYNIVLGFDGTSCKLPAELHAGAVKMSIFGYDAESDTTIRATTVPITLNIRESGFVGDDDTPIPPTPDLYTQLLQKITEIQSGVNGKDGLSAYEIAKENGFVGTVSEWLESLKGADGRDGVDGKNGVDGRDGIIPDMSEYPKTTAVENMIETQIAPILESSHTHENMLILEALTDDYLAMLNGLQQFEDSTKYDIQTIRESIEPVISQAHWHHNLTLLNSITAAKISQWDNISDFELRLQSLRDDVMDYQMQMNYRMENADNDIAEIQSDVQQLRDSTQYDQQIQNDAILNLENRITILESQIASGNSAATLFSAGSDVFEKYDNSLVFMVNNGTYPLTRFVEQYPDFCGENTDFSLNYSSAVFNWGVTIQSAFCNSVRITPNSKVLLEYLAGANSDSELYFVSPDGRSESTPIADFIFEKIKNNDCRKVPFEWLYSANYITTLILCSDIPAGEYYLAWTGVSDNTHPLVRRIQILS